MAEKIKQPFQKDSKVYDTSADTLDALFAQIRMVCGECKVDIYDDDVLDSQRRDADIHITYDNEFSCWIAEIIIPRPWWE